MESPYGDYLPIFPCLDYQPITEDRIERTIERLYNRADAALMNDKATQAQYDAWTKVLNNWADKQYQAIGKLHWAYQTRQSCQTNARPADKAGFCIYSAIPVQYGL